MGGGVHCFPRGIHVLPLGASAGAQIWIWIWRQRWRPDLDLDSALASALEHAGEGDKDSCGLEGQEY